MKDLGKLNKFLGIDFKQSDGQVTLTQEVYINKILTKFGMQDCTPRETPCEPNLEYTYHAKRLEEPTVYRKAVESMIHLATCTRPDLSFVVSKLSLHLAKPTEGHWNTVKHVFRYLKGTANHGLCFKRYRSPRPDSP